MRGITPMTVAAPSLVCTTRPMMFASAPKRRRHNPSLSTISFGAFGSASASVNVRPSAGDAPSTTNMSGVTERPSTRSGTSPSVITIEDHVYDASPLNDFARSRQSRKFCGLTMFRSNWRPSFFSQTFTSAWESRYGSGRSRTRSTTVRIVAVEPIPRASVATASPVKRGLLRSALPAWRRSCRTDSMGTSLRLLR